MVTALGFIPAPRDESGNNHEREREIAGKNRVLDKN